MNPSPEPVAYLFYGQDEPALKERLAAFTDAFTDPASADLNTVQLDGRTSQLGELRSAAGTLPFLADLRVVIVENLTETPGGRDIIGELPELLPDIPDSTRIAFVEIGLDGDPFKSKFTDSSLLKSRRPFIKKLIQLVENDPRGHVFSFEQPKDIISWLKKRAAHYGAEIDLAAARELAGRINDNLSLADVELEKLAVYTGEGGVIPIDAVKALTPYAAGGQIFDLVDAMGQRRSADALSILRQLLSGGEAPLAVLGMIVRQYRLLILMREQLDRGANINSAGGAIGVHGFVAKKLGQQAYLYTIDQLETCYNSLLETDIAIKTGVSEPEIALELLIVRLVV
nr:DNA polymerase III subunit delta [Anaerolineae bacterium]